jgi:hypothetical protein
MLARMIPNPQDELMRRRGTPPITPDRSRCIVLHRQNRIERSAAQAGNARAQFMIPHRHQDAQ